MATETDAAKTFKMHTPLIGNRADCDRGGNERPCVYEGGGREGGRRESPITKGSRKPGRTEQEWGCLIR